MTAFPDITPIRTERLVLRGFAPADYPAYEAYYTDPARTGGVGGALPPHQAFERFCSMIGHWAMRGFGRYAITTGGRAIGHVGPQQVEDHHEPEMTWTLWDPAETGKGYATEAARAVLQDLFAAGWTRLIALIHTENAASVAVVRRLGGVEDTSIPLPSYINKGLRFALSPETLR